MASPRYFFAMFGDPKPPEKDEVESGIYHPDSRFAPFPTRAGDVLLLYCTENYGAHSMEVPGVGVVLRVDRQVVEYRYLPFAAPVPKSKLDTCFSSADLDKFSNRRFSNFWLFEISRASFAATLESTTIAWP